MFSAYSACCVDTDLVGAAEHQKHAVAPDGFFDGDLSETCISPLNW